MIRSRSLASCTSISGSCGHPRTPADSDRRPVLGHHPGIRFIAMVHARSFSQIETLRSGLSITIRAVRSTDKAGIARAFRRLDPESIYTRFFQAKAALSDEELKTATEVDFERVVALVATVESEGTETVIGSGRYVAFDSAAGRTAEVAFSVEEDYQGQGIATRILNHLVRIAREKGVD